VTTFGLLRTNFEFKGGIGVYHTFSYNISDC